MNGRRATCLNGRFDSIPSHESRRDQERRNPGPAMNPTSADSPFELEKWYMDMITPDGAVFILYAARLRWKSLTVRYNSLLERTPDGAIDLNWWVRRVVFPTLSGSGVGGQGKGQGEGQGEAGERPEKIQFMAPDRRIQGCWTALAHPIRETLFDTDHGRLTWTCHMPSAKAWLAINGREHAGSGYVEHLHMTIPYWKIGMRTLRWGRFESGGDHTVWIQVEPLRQWCWHNGVPEPRATITDSSVRLPDHDLEICFTPVQALESERKIFNVLKSLDRHLPGFRSSIPKADLMADETKWLSNAARLRISAPESVLPPPQAPAYVLHERVDFG